MPKCIHCNEFLIQLGDCWWCPICGTVVDEKGEWKSPRNRKLSWIEEHDLRVEKERLAQEQAKQKAQVEFTGLSISTPVVEEKTEESVEEVMPPSQVKRVVKGITDRFKGR